MRDDDTLTELVATAERNLQELKELQIFGGDALKVQEFTELLGRGNQVEYTLTLTPDDELGVLPSKCDLVYDNPNDSAQMSSNFSIWQVYRDDGIFEWYITGTTSMPWSNYDTKILLQYIGKGTVTLTRTV